MPNEKAHASDVYGVDRNGAAGEVAGVAVGTIVLTSENDVSWPLWGEKDTLHYTIETSAMIYFVEYTYKPGQHNNGHGPNIALNVPTKIAIGGKHAYALDANGREVKLHILKKTAK
jgi:hypothetical protein